MIAFLHNNIYLVFINKNLNVYGGTMQKHAQFLFVVLIIMIAACSRTQPETNAIQSYINDWQKYPIAIS